MPKRQPQNLVKLDGRTGEGGGQIVRVALPLAALTRASLRIDCVRGNRPGKRGGGLKAQHVAGIKCLAEATGAEVAGCAEGSKTFEFKAKLSPAELVNRNIRIKSQSAGSTLLVFQAILPFLVFAGDENRSPIAVTIEGGTNVSFSLSFEYLDQVLLPALERFGILVERQLETRGWSHGTRQLGSVKFKIHPLAPGQCLHAPEWPVEQGTLTHIDVSLVVPIYLQDTLKQAIGSRLETVFPDVKSNFKIVDDSRHQARIYALLVAHTSTGLRFGRDWLYDQRTKDKSGHEISAAVSRRIVKELYAEIEKGGVIDEYLQDQLIVFQALAGGQSCIPGSAKALSSDHQRVDQTDEPFGDGSLHTTTARWVVSQLLPSVKWIDNGRICDGVGWTV